jgi:hypothetical protein
LNFNLIHQGKLAIQGSFQQNSETWLYIGVGIFYLLGIWEHSNGNIYSDIAAVYTNRFCTPGPCITSGLPYINFFVEYPPLTGFFIYAMGMLAHLLPFPGRTLLTSYYDYTSIFLLLPTILLVSNLLKVSSLLRIGQKQKILFLFFVATPSFVFMLLLNWYVIGVCLTVWSLRKFLELKTRPASNPARKRNDLIFSGGLIGLSVVANLVTAVPALGILVFGVDDLKDAFYFVLGILATVLAVYLPILALNSFPHAYLNPSHVVVSYHFLFPNLNVITDFLQYEQSWYAEGSWMLALFPSTDNIRHVIFPVLFVAFSAVIIVRGFQTKKLLADNGERSKLVVISSALFTFAFLFSTYVCTPQMNIMLLPFFVLIPLLRRNYAEFLTFEIINSLVIVWGFSSPLMFLGITIPSPVAFGSPWVSPIQFLAVVRSLWIGKFLIYNGLLRWKSAFPQISEESQKLVVVHHSVPPDLNTIETDFYGQQF